MSNNLYCRCLYLTLTLTIYVKIIHRVVQNINRLSYPIIYRPAIKYLSLLNPCTHIWSVAFWFNNSKCSTGHLNFTRVVPSPIKAVCSRFQPAPPEKLPPTTVILKMPGTTSPRWKLLMTLTWNKIAPDTNCLAWVFIIAEEDSMPDKPRKLILNMRRIFTTNACKLEAMMKIMAWWKEKSPWAHDLLPSFL